MNGSSGIQPTVELATTNGGNGFYPYPIMYGNNGGFGNSGFLGGDGWIVLLLLLAFGGNWGNNGGFFGGNGGFDNGYAWLSNGQKEIMQNTNNGFDTLQLSNQIEGVKNGITSGFYNAEIAANSRQMADMNQNFSNQVTTLNGFNNLNNALQQCCCDNRLATVQTQNVVQSEGSATRFADANNTRDIITNATANTQAILDKLCQLELDGVKAQVEAKNDRIAELQRELTAADLKASQTAQNAFIAQGFSNEVDQLYNRLNNCPVPSTPVYGRTPIFTCNNNGCGCSGNANLF